MKLLIIGSLILPSSWCFAPVRFPYLRQSVKLAEGMSTEDAEAHMKEAPHIWDDLRQVERDIVVQHELEGKDMSHAAEMLAERMLEAALDFVQTQERIEEDHAFSAHQDFMHALEEEHELDEFVTDEHMKDIPMDTYVAARLQAVRDAEVKAMKDEDEALHHLDDLYEKEKALKESLEELKKIARDTKFTP